MLHAAEKKRIHNEQIARVETITPLAGPALAWPSRTRLTHVDGGEAMETQAATVNVTVCYWEESSGGRSTPTTRTVPVPHGSPVIWIWGRFAALFKTGIGRLLSPDQDVRFHIRGAEVFWFSPVEKTSVLHVIATS